LGIDYKLLTEETPFDAASLNDRFSDIQASVNDLSPADIEIGALRKEHLPGHDLGSDTDVIGNTTQNYLNLFPGTGSNTTGAHSAGTTAWCVIGGPTGADLEVDGIAANLIHVTDADFTQGVLVLLNVHVEDIQANLGGGTVWTGVDPAFACFAIQVYLGGASAGWKTLQGTERILRNVFQKATGVPTFEVPYIYADVAIRTLIQFSDVTGWPDWDGTVQKVRGVVSIYPGSVIAAHTAPTGGLLVTLGEANISAVAVRGGSLV